ncbi:MAG TPA: hypothetical protein VK809_02420 [Bacteroidia bacterium]|jgi:hypothetical protein|nr:hypothetical protein [Bacteroidia bacterium]
MKKPKAERRRIRAKKHEQKIATTATFSDMLKASTENARNVVKKKKG